MTAEPVVLTRVVGPMSNNCYALIDPAGSEAAIIDPGFGGVAILEDLPEEVRVSLILLTHGHFDHVADVAELAKATGARVGIHRADAAMMVSADELAGAFGLSLITPPAPGFFLSPGSPVRVGSLEIEVRHTPGHSPGGVALVLPGLAFTGDSLFAGSIGRTDLPGASYAELMESIETQLLTLPDETRVLPGHGPSTTIARERATNPFLADPASYVP